MPKYSKEVTVDGKSSSELYDAVSGSIDRFLSKTPIGKYDLNKDDGAKTIDIKSSMFNGKVSCSDGSIRLDGSLSLIASPFKGKMDEGIEKWISKTFA